MKISQLPAREGARCAHKFLPFINSKGNTDQLAPVTKNIITENYESVTETLNSMAEQSGYTTPSEEAPEPSVLDHLNSEHSSDESNTVIANEPEKMSNRNKDIPFNTPDETLKVVSGSVTKCTLLQAMSINKVKVELKGIKRNAPVIALAERSRVKGIQMETGIYSSIKGRLEIFLTSTVHKDTTLKKGTQLGLFQICKTLEVVTENKHEDAPEVVEHVCSVQGDLELGRKFQNHLNSTSCPDLEQELINLLLKYKAAVAFPGDA